MIKERLSRPGEITSWLKERLKEGRVLTDEELVQVAGEIELTKAKRRITKDERETTGERAMLVDIVTIVGSDRGLWDESGYSHGITPRMIDAEFSEKCVDLTRDLYSRDHPWPIILILQLKHGVRMIDDQSLLEIFEVLSETWEAEYEGDVVFDWRLQTLRFGVAMVLFGRGYEVQLEYV